MRSATPCSPKLAFRSAMRDLPAPSPTKRCAGSVSSMRCCAASSPKRRRRIAPARRSKSCLPERANFCSSTSRPTPPSMPPTASPRTTPRPCISNRSSMRRSGGSHAKARRSSPLRTPSVSTRPTGFGSAGSKPMARPWRGKSRTPISAPRRWIFSAPTKAPCVARLARQRWLCPAACCALPMPDASKPSRVFPKENGGFRISRRRFPRGFWAT